LWLRRSLKSLHLLFAKEGITPQKLDDLLPCNHRFQKQIVYNYCCFWKSNLKSRPEKSILSSFFPNNPQKKVAVSSLAKLESGYGEPVTGPQRTAEF
jgi:hypothetical protein